MEPRPEKRGSPDFATVAVTVLAKTWMPREDSNLN